MVRPVGDLDPDDKFVASGEYLVLKCLCFFYCFHPVDVGNWPKKHSEVNASVILEILFPDYWLKLVNERLQRVNDLKYLFSKELLVAVLSL